MTAGPVGPSAEFAWFTALPGCGGNGLATIAGVTGQVLALRPLTAYPPLIVKDGESYRFVEPDADAPPEAFRPPIIVPLPTADRRPLDARKVDAILIVPPEFREKLLHDEVPTLEVLRRGRRNVQTRGPAGDGHPAGVSIYLAANEILAGRIAADLRSGSHHPRS